MPLLLLAYLAFIGLGLPDTLPGTLWPVLRADYGAPQAALGLLLAATATGTFTASLLAGQLIAALGIGGVLAGSVAVTAAAALGFALAPPFPVLVLLALFGGCGGGAVDAALNAFAATRFAPRHLNWMHACWGLGATLGPAIATALLAAGFPWRAAWGAVGLVLAALALGFLATRGRWQAREREAMAATRPRLSALSVLRLPLARWQIAAFVLYCGLEAGTGQWAATVLVERWDATPEAGGAATALFWASLALGRVALGFVVDRLGADRLLRAMLLPVLLGSAGFALGLAGPALALLAVALAPLYPTLMARTPARLGAAAAAHAVGFQVAAATFGAGVLPALLGLAPLATVPWLLLGLAAALAFALRRILGSGQVG
ncbi:MFS transporter [Siccirubricoccus sp. KC 17139]|uniref:MFS transporter n=1 Tax=Siccirubricoccus soli TaxID=2899147 RepID=A0ABT1CZL7_9PROT|nr:MFS transporter [Siccirubricoccus soli]MCP2681249.1 MFS transporter [Siccirubricoccus soli]